MATVLCAPINLSLARCLLARWLSSALFECVNKGIMVTIVPRDTSLATPTTGNTPAGYGRLRTMGNTIDTKDLF